MKWKPDRLLSCLIVQLIYNYWKLGFDSLQRIKFGTQQKSTTKWQCFSAIFPEENH